VTAEEVLIATMQQERKQLRTGQGSSRVCAGTWDVALKCSCELMGNIIFEKKKLHKLIMYGIETIIEKAQNKYVSTPSLISSSASVSKSILIGMRRFRPLCPI
jgi:hypothetical protein